MHDRWEATVPAGTAEDDAVKVECKISPGLLTDLVVYFPPGCHGLVRSRIFLGEKPIAPRSAKGWLAADGDAVEIHNANELISENLPMLTWTLWSPSAAYPHTLWMSAEWAGVDEPYDKQTVAILKDFVKVLKKLIGVD